MEVSRTGVGRWGKNEEKMVHQYLLKSLFIFFLSELKPIEHIRNLGAYLSCLVSYQAQPLFVQQLWEEILGRSKQRVVVPTPLFEANKLTSQ